MAIPIQPRFKVRSKASCVPKHILFSNRNFRRSTITIKYKTFLSVWRWCYWAGCTCEVSNPSLLGEHSIWKVTSWMQTKTWRLEIAFGLFSGAMQLAGSPEADILVVLQWRFRWRIREWECWGSSQTINEQNCRRREEKWTHDICVVWDSRVLSACTLAKEQRSSL